MKNKINSKIAKCICKLLKVFYNIKIKKKGIKVTMNKIGNSQALIEVNINEQSLKEYFLSKEEMQTIIANLDKKIDDLKSINSEASSKIQGITDKLESLEQDNKDNIAKIPHLESRIHELEECISNKEKEVDESKKKVSELEQENIELKKELISIYIIFIVNCQRIFVRILAI